MDSLEILLIDSLMKALPEVVNTKEAARNLIGKVGSRITFGKDIYRDAIINNHKKIDL